MAKDGTNRGGRRVRAGDKPDALADKIAQGKAAAVEMDENFTILSGHGWVEAAKAEGMTELPYVMLTGMTEAEKKAYIIAVNRSAPHWMRAGMKSCWPWNWRPCRRCLSICP